MTWRRLLLFSLGVLLLGLLGAGLYVYDRLPQLVGDGASEYLEEYGVRSVTLSNLDISAARLGADRIDISGDWQGQHFEATLHAAELSYLWRELLNGELHSLRLARLEIQLGSTEAQQQDARDALRLAGILPFELFKSLPLDSLLVDQWQLNFQPVAADLVMATGSLHYDKQLSFHFETNVLQAGLKAQLIASEELPLYAVIDLYRSEEDLGTVEVSLNALPNAAWQWSLQGQFAHQPTLRWLRESGPELRELFSSDALAALSWRGNTQFEGSVRHKDRLLLDREDLPSLLEQFDAQVRADHDVRELAYLEVLHAASSRFTTRFSLAEGALSLQVPPFQVRGNLHAAALGLSEDAMAWLDWEPQVPLRFGTLEVSTVDMGRGEDVALAPVTAHLTLGNDHSSIELETLTLEAATLADSPGEFTAGIAGGLRAQLRRTALPSSRLSLSHRGSLQSSNYRVQLEELANSFRLAVRGDLDATTGEGTAQIDLQSADVSSAADSVLPLLKAFDLFHGNLALAGGQASLNTTLHSNEYSLAGLQQKSRLVVTDVAGSYGEYTFENLDFEAAWSGVQHWQTVQPATLDLAVLDVGFPVSAIHAVIELPKPTPFAQPRVRLAAFSAECFGGLVSLPRQSLWDFSRARNSVTVRAKGWQLPEILALQQNENVQVSGVLEGELPLVMADGRLIIDNGFVRALPPGGNITYKPDESGGGVAASSEELAMALDLLENFDYQTLSSSVQLDKGGKLLLSLSLSGKNPGLFEGRPVNFNINLEQNIDPLLQTLRLNDKLTEELERRQK